MVTAALWAVPVIVLAGCAAWASAALRGHHGGHGRLACLRRTLRIRVLIAATLAAICAVRAGRTIRHPARHARCLAVKVLRRIPGQPGDGDPLDPDEARAFIAICRGWKTTAERTRT